MARRPAAALLGAQEEPGRRWRRTRDDPVVSPSCRTGLQLCRYVHVRSLYSLAAQGLTRPRSSGTSQSALRLRHTHNHALCVETNAEARFRRSGATSRRTAALTGAIRFHSVTWALIELMHLEGLVSKPNMRCFRPRPHMTAIRARSPQRLWRMVEKSPWEFYSHVAPGWKSSVHRCRDGDQYAPKRKRLNAWSIGNWAWGLG